MTQATRKATRLIELQRLLRRHPQGLTVQELADILGYSARTVQRDLLDLEADLRQPVIRNGRRVRLSSDSAPLAPVRFTLQEARAMYLASRLFMRFADEFDPDGASAMEKLAEALPEPLATQVVATAQILQSRPGKPAQTRVLQQLTLCWAEARTAHIVYQSQGKGTTKSVHLDPYLLEPSSTGAATYVIGYSHEHEAVRTFKIDRIESATPTDRHFAMPDTRALATKISESWGVMFGDESYPVVVDFLPEVAARVAETNWHATAQLEHLDGGGVRLKLTLPSLVEFVPWVRSWGHTAIVREPAELRRQVAESLSRAAQLYHEDPGA